MPFWGGESATLESSKGSGAFVTLHTFSGARMTRKEHIGGEKITEKLEIKEFYTISYACTTLHVAKRC